MVVNLNLSVNFARKGYMMDILDIACECLRVNNTNQKNLSSVLLIIQCSGRDGGARMIEKHE